MANPIIISEPEKTINGFVSKWNAIALPVQYIVSNDKYPTGATVTNYRTEIDIWVNGSLIASISQLPDSDNETRIDIRKYLQTVLKFIPSNGNIISSSVENDTNAWCTFYIEGSEKYTDSGGVDQENTLDNSGNEFYGTLSSLQLGNNNGGNMYDYVLDSTKTDLAQWLTVLNSGDIVDTLSSFIISTIVNDPEFDLVVKQFDINGIELQEDISSIADLGIGLYRIPLDFLTVNIDVNRISILAQKSSTDISETYMISTNLDCLDIADAPTEFTFTTATVTTLDATCVSIETSFQWEIATDIAFSSIVQTINNSSTSVQFTGLTGGTEYFGRVKALGIISSPYSNIDNSNTLVDYSDAEAILSMRAVLSIAQVTYIARVKRLSDNAETDILMPANMNDFVTDNSIVSAGGTLVDWHNDSFDTLYVTWYDQQGNGHDVTQSVTANAYRCIVAGNNTISTKGGLAAMRSDSPIYSMSKGSGITALNYPNDFTVISVASIVSTTVAADRGLLWANNNAITDRIECYLLGKDNGALNDQHSIIKGLNGSNYHVLYSTLIGNADVNAHILLRDNGGSYGFHNEVIDDQNTALPSGYTNNDFTFVSYPSVNSLIGTRQEHIIFPTSKLGDLDKYKNDIRVRFNTTW